MRNGNERRTEDSEEGPDLTICSLAKFAAAVRIAAAVVGTDKRERFGHRKVFIWAAHAYLTSAGYRVGELEIFKARLVLARTAGLLQLARADLVAAMPTDAVIASELDDHGAEHHFIIDRAARDPWTTRADVA